VKIDSVVHKVDVVANSNNSVRSDWKPNQGPHDILPDSCGSSSVVSVSADTSVANSSNISETSDDETATASVPKDSDEDEEPDAEASDKGSTLKLLEDGGNALDDILFDALKGIDGFNGDTSFAL